MTPKPLARAAACAVTALMVMFAAPARASAQPRLHFTPMFDVFQAYDSNLLFTSRERERDFQTRVSPGVEARYDSPLLTLSTRYALDADRFADHPELSAVNGQRAAVDLRYSPTRRVGIALDGTFVQTHTPGELNVDTAVGLRRAEAQRLLLHSSIDRELSRTSDAVFEYSLTEDRLAGGSALDSRRAAVRLEHHPSSRATTTLRYEVARFDFAATTLVTTHTVTLGWARSLTQETSVTLSGGSRVAAGRMRPELTASVRWLERAFEASVDYARSQVTLIGVPGLVATDTLTAPVRWTTSRRLAVTFSPGISRLEYQGAADLAYRVRLEATRAVTPHTSWIAAYDGTLQQGHIYAIGLPQPGPIARHVVSVGVRRTQDRGELR